MDTRGFFNYCKLTYFLSTKNLAKITKAINPTNPPSPKLLTSAVRLATTSIPNTVPPVNTFHRIATGSSAIIIDNNPPKNPCYILNYIFHFFNF